MKNNRCESLKEVQNALRKAVDDLGSDDQIERIHALIYLGYAINRLLGLARKDNVGVEWESIFDNIGKN